VLRWLDAADEYITQLDIFDAASGKWRTYDAGPYDIANGTWPSPRMWPRMEFLNETHVIMLGGTRDRDIFDVWLLDVVHISWSRVETLPVFPGTASPESVGIDTYFMTRNATHVFIFGGYKCVENGAWALGGYSCYLNSLYVIDSALNVATFDDGGSDPNWPSGRCYGELAVLGDYLLVYSGTFSSSGSVLVHYNELHIWHTQKNTWLAVNMRGTPPYKSTQGVVGAGFSLMPELNGVYLYGG
jgi:hypothetical protein